MAFIDELARLNQQNFGSGLAKMGEAIKESEQNKTLVQLWNEFQLEKDRLSTSGEQLSEFNKKYDANTDENGFLTRGAPPKDRTNPDVEATLNLAKYMQTQQALLGTYEPFIQAFSVLGEDGVKIAKTLTDELARTLVLEEQKSEIPYREEQYKQIVMANKFDKAKIDDWHKRVDREWRLLEVQDAALSSELWDNIQKVRANYNTNAGKTAIKNWQLNVENLKKELVAKFPNLNASDIGVAVESMIAQYDRGLSTEEYEPKVVGGSGSGSGFDPFAVDMAASFAEQFTATFNSLGQDMKEAVRIYQQDGYIPEKVINPLTGEPVKIDKDRVQTVINDAIKFMKAQDVLNYASGYKWFDKAETEVSLGVDKDGKPLSSKMNMPTIKLRDQSTGNIMRVRTLPDLFNMRFDYNPHEKERLKKQQGAVIDGVNNSNVYSGNKRDFSNEVVNFMYDDADMSIVVDAFENLILSGYEVFSDKKIKTTEELRQK